VLASGAVACAVAWGIAAGCGLFAALSFIMAEASELAPYRGVARALSLLCRAIVTSSWLWRARYVQSLPHVALWIEERIPGLEYALVTAAEERDAPHQRA